jgi:CTP-dependent riboflavin kinase
MNNNITKKNIGSSQDFVPIKEIKDGIVILDDGTLVSISLVTSVNISLKSAEEQASTIGSFQAFLNILEFPVQISVQSRKLDIDPYLETLETRLKEQDNEIIKLQTIEYISFIKNFTDSINIMDKQFFMVVSYKPVLINSSAGGIFSFFSKKTKEQTDESSRTVFVEARSQLEQRVGLLSSGLSRTGVKIKRLDTEAALEVFYSIFNSGDNNHKI